MNALQLKLREFDAYQVVRFVHGERIDYKTLRSPELQLVPGKGVIFSGRSPTWLYAWSALQAADAPWVGVYDPRESTVVIVHTRVSEYCVGCTFPIPPEHVQATPPENVSEKPKRQQQGVRLALVGPPHSGKSVFGYALAQALRVRLPDRVFFLRAVPDGEGNWFAEMPPEQARLHRIKGAWSEDFVRSVEREIEGLGQTKPLLLVDTGGKIDRYTYRILQACTHAVVVSGRPDGVLEWIGVIKAAEAQPLAVVYSSLEEVSKVLRSEIPMELRVGPTERGKQPAIPEVFLTYLINLVR